MQIKLARARMHTLDNEFLDGLALKYPDTPTQDRPIILSQESYIKLVDIAISEQLILTTAKGKSASLLTILIGMGTSQCPIVSSNPANHDEYLGQKDPRIEAYIATRAKDEIARRQQAAIDHTKHIAVFGSSMNPPTDNHITFIKHLIHSGYFVEVLPNAASPLKTPAQYAPPWDRYEMICLALQERTKDIPATQYHVSTVEIERPAPSRMFMTLCALILLSEPDTKFTLMLTLDDNLEGFHKWYKWSEFGELCDIQFYPRPGVTETIAPEVIRSQLNKLLKTGTHVIIPYYSDTEKEALQSLLGSEIAGQIEWRKEEELQTTEGSSSIIRDQLKAMPDECPSGLSTTVYQYILDRRLYG